MSWLDHQRRLYGTDTAALERAVAERLHTVHHPSLHDDAFATLPKRVQDCWIARAQRMLALGEAA